MKNLFAGPGGLSSLVAVAVLAAPSAASTTAPLVGYSSVTTEVVEAECPEAMVAADSIIDAMIAVPDGERTFGNTMMLLDRVLGLLEEAYGRYAFLGYVATDPELRDAARAQQEALDKYKVDLGFREDVHAAVSDYAKTAEAAELEGEHARLVEHTLRDFRRNGFDADPAVRDSVRALKERLVELEVAFDKNLAEWEDGIEVPPDRTAGLSERYLQGLETRDNGNVWVSLDYPDLYPFLERAEDAELREELTRRDWNQAYPDNVAILEEAIVLRSRIAELLGYESWAHHVLEVRMAETPANVRVFLEDLRAKVRVKFDADLATMERDCAPYDADGIDYWDWRFCDTKQLESKYQVDHEQLAEYFPLQRVINGLFDLTQEVFGLRYVEIENPDVWHPDVQLFEIHDAATGELIAHVYTDLFPRDGKYGHAAAFTLRPGGSNEDGSRRIPVSAIVANLPKPTAETPALLTHDDIETLFHEFGHILHQALTRARLTRFAGTATERDFVEAPSQILEHWIWIPEVLDRFAAHYETGEPIPRDMLERLVAAKHLNSGIKTLRQIFYGMLDQAYHGPGATTNTTAILNELHPICGFPNLEGTHMQAGFGHLFGYDASYYGYLWAKVYGDDMFTVFEENGIYDPAVGERYRREIYEKGGTLDGNELVRNFLGREPNNEAFLRDLGLAR